MNFINKNGKGLFLCLALAVPSWFLGKAFPHRRRRCHCNFGRDDRDSAD